MRRAIAVTYNLFSPPLWGRVGEGLPSSPVLVAYPSPTKGGENVKQLRRDFVATDEFSLNLPCLFRQHDRDAVADRIGELR
jgi:hypothetical protein